MKPEMRLGELKVKDIRHLLVENPASVSSDTSVRDVMQKMTEDLRTRQVYVVDDDNHLLGAVRMGSVVELLFPFDAILQLNDSPYVAYIPKTGAKTAADLMISPPVRVTEETTLGQMAGLLMKEGINEVPVVDEHEHLIGQVNMYEAINAYLAIERGHLAD